MKRSKQLVVVIIIVIVVFSVNEFLLKGAKKNVLPAQSITETFIVDHLEARNHLIRTNITDRAEEYLSESVGLWLYYLQEVQNEGRFAKQVEAFNYHFSGLLISHFYTLKALIFSTQAEINAVH